MERKIKWFVFEHYVGYTITDLLMKYFTVFAVGFIVAPLVQMTEMGSYDSINLTDKGIIPLMIVLGVFATVFSIFFTILSRSEKYLLTFRSTNATNKERFTSSILSNASS